MKVDDFVFKWKILKVLDEQCVKYIRSSQSKPGSMFGFIMTHKANNSARVITNNCATPIKFFSIFAEKYLHKEVDKIHSRIMDIPGMLDIIDDINLEILSNREYNFLRAKCILEALTTCLKYNNLVFDNVFYLWENSSAMGLHMLYSYSDIATYRFDIKALNYKPGVQCWKRFTDDIFCFWNHSLQELQKFFEFMNNVDTTGKIKFPMSLANELVLEFLDLSLHIDEHNKICVDVFAKPTNSFRYVLSSTCYPKKNINNVPKGIALRLRRICDTDEKFDICSYKYQNYLIARDYKPSLVKRQFHAIKNISRREARQVKPKVIKSNFNLITVNNPVMKNLEKVLNGDLHILHSTPDMKKMFHERTISVTYRRGKCLKELISPSLYPQTVTEPTSRVSKCNESRCDICRNHMVFKNKFTCTTSLVLLQVRHTR